MIKIKDHLLNSSRKTKISLVASTDFICIFIATYISLIISGTDLAALSSFDFLRLLWVPFFSVVVFYFLCVYKSVVRYINFSVIYIILRAILVAFSLNLCFKFFLIYLSKFTVILPDISAPLITNPGWFVGFSTTILLVIGSRILANYYLTENSYGNRVVIYGAGSAGIQLASALRVSKEMHPVAFVDSNASLQGSFLAGIKILHPKRLQRLVLME